jgi:hypothetical protein
MKRGSRHFGKITGKHSRPQFHLPPLRTLASWRTWGHLVAKVGTSKRGGTQWQTTPKNLPRMQRTWAIPVAWLSSGLCSDRPKGWIPIIIIIMLTPNMAFGRMYGNEQLKLKASFRIQWDTVFHGGRCSDVRRQTGRKAYNSARCNKPHLNHTLFAIAWSSPKDTIHRNAILYVQ